MIEVFDYGVLDLFQSIHTPVLDRIMILFTTMGEYGAIWIVAGILLLCTRKYRMYGLMLLSALLLGLLLGNGILKNVIARPRPCWRHSEVAMLISIPKDFSFPSGHTLAACEAITVLFCTNRRYGLAALAVGLLVIASRMYLYVHYPTDILAGAFLGVLIGLFSVMLYKKLWKDKIIDETI